MICVAIVFEGGHTKPYFSERCSALSEQGILPSPLPRGTCRNCPNINSQRTTCAYWQHFAYPRISSESNRRLLTQTVGKRNHSCNSFIASALTTWEDIGNQMSFWGRGKQPQMPNPKPARKKDAIQVTCKGPTMHGALISQCDSTVPARL
eukprot:2073519-Amphidinium_carterae.1